MKHLTDLSPRRRFCALILTMLLFIGAENVLLHIRYASLKKHLQSQSDPRVGNAYGNLHSNIYPANYGVDTYAKWLEGYDKHKKDFDKLHDPDYETTRPAPDFKPSEMIHFKGDVYKVVLCGKKNCIYDQMSNKQRKALDHMIADNQLLFERYHLFLSYPHYLSVQYGYDSNGSAQAYMNVTRLYILQLQKIAETDPDRAAKEWLYLAFGLRRYLSDEILLFDRAILMMMYNLTLGSMPFIIKDPVTIEKYKVPLQQLLASNAASNMNARGTAMAEYHLASPLLQALHLRSKLTYMQLLTDLETLPSLPAEQVMPRFNMLRKCYSRVWILRDWWYPIESSIVNLLMLGAVRGGELTVSMHATEQRSKLLQFYLQVAAQRVGQALPEFAMTFPEDAQYFSWDKEKRQMRYTAPVTPEVLLEY